MATYIYDGPIGAKIKALVSQVLRNAEIETWEDEYYYRIELKCDLNGTRKRVVGYQWHDSSAEIDTTMILNEVAELSQDLGYLLFIDKDAEWKLLYPQPNGI